MNRVNRVQLAVDGHSLDSTRRYFYVGGLLSPGSLADCL